MASVVAGGLAAVAFALRERSARYPILPLALFASRRFSVTNTVTFVVYAALGGVLFLRAATLARGFRTAALIAGCLCVAGGLLAFLGLRDPRPASGSPPEAGMYCALDATPLRAGPRGAERPATGDRRPARADRT